MQAEELIKEQTAFVARCETLVRTYRAEKSFVPHILANSSAGTAVFPGQDIAINNARFDREKSIEWLNYVAASSAKFPNVAGKYREALDYAQGIWQTYVN